MRYDVSHRTRFRYAYPVRFARSNLRLEPIDWGRTDGGEPRDPGGARRIVRHAARRRLCG